MAIKVQVLDTEFRINQLSIIAITSGSNKMLVDQVKEYAEEIKHDLLLSINPDPDFFLAKELVKRFQGEAKILTSREEIEAEVPPIDEGVVY